ncbi:Argininosuccinate lyase [Rubripirellula lacrimiformis]|uniref:Argininosuccinate lyase n=1 Tax=Rubripirellula lacrimiformis TaxID=1930273 RepID=A0A517NKJ8_9BACT|nr:argininosuccinate lyase [Rubripirellula lacrimiformis]QDT07650.1 Argininosuccinate lyase [Rubripirellula lacrimiformis]
MSTDQNPSQQASPSRSGVFHAETDQRLESFAESISFDRRLYQHDIRGSIAHSDMLASVGLISRDEATEIQKALREIEVELDTDRLPIRFELEDIHMHVEQALIDRIGDVGRKLHTARSRNDQVSTDIRMWIRDALDRLDSSLAALQAAFLGRCDADFDVVLPAYTHLQRAQPVLAPHYWLAYIEKFARDRDRLADCRARVNQCPLGVAAVAGTTLPIDRDQTAKALDFDGVTANSLDTSSDRDFMLETAFVLSVVASHLSGWAEEWILWSTVEFNFIKMPHAFCTGSSIMPQKVNPDTLELTRGKSARVMGNLQTLMLLVKNLPMAYNRDLQEDKPPLFDSFDTVLAMLELATPIVQGSVLQRESIASRLERGYLDATTLMEWMIAKGMPQRRAHHLVGAIVGEAMQRDVPLADLPIDVLQSHAPEIDKTIYECLGSRNAVDAFVSYGSTAPDQVRAQIDRWKKQLG